MPGKPQGKQRPKINKKTGVVYTPVETKQYERLVSDLYKEKVGRFSFKDLPVSITIKSYFNPLKKHLKEFGDEFKVKVNSDRMYCTLPADIDNIAKIILDGLNNVAYFDDCQVVRVVSEKYYSNNMRVEVSITDEIY